MNRDLNVLKLILASTAAISLAALVGCEGDTDAEDAAENAAETIEENAEDAADATEDGMEDAADEMEDAADDMGN